jgi:hypothetical protein
VSDPVDEFSGMTVHTTSEFFAAIRESVLLVPVLTLARDLVTDIAGFVKYSSRLKKALEPHVVALLGKGMSVVLDLPGNTKAQRAWFREVFNVVRHEGA